MQIVFQKRIREDINTQGQEALEIRDGLVAFSMN